MKREKNLKIKMEMILFKKPIYLEGDKNGINIECSLEWNSGYSEDMHTYTNNIFQKDGGTHLLGFRSSLTRILNKYVNENNILKKNQVSITGDDIKEGFMCCIIY